MPSSMKSVMQMLLLLGSHNLQAIVTFFILLFNPFLKSWPGPLPQPTHCEFELFKLPAGCLNIKPYFTLDLFFRNTYYYNFC